MMKTCREMAVNWNVTVRTVTNLCRSGKIPGAFKKGKYWYIPDDAIKLSDGRFLSGKYQKKEVEFRILFVLNLNIITWIRLY